MSIIIVKMSFYLNIKFITAISKSIKDSIDIKQKKQKQTKIKKQNNNTNRSILYCSIQSRLQYLLLRRLENYLKRYVDIQIIT